MEILIVEDELEIARLIQLSLEKEGFSCHSCRDGVNALQVFQEQQPDLIILDLMLPELDGLEVCARIRQKSGAKDPYILMLTAKGEEIDRVIGLSTGADDYMVKPFSPRELDVASVKADNIRSTALAFYARYRATFCQHISAQFRHFRNPGLNHFGI